MLCRDCPDVVTTSMTVCHCAGCHMTFGSITAFDMHRTGPWSERVCVDSATLRIASGPRKGEPRLVLLDRPYECWGRPGNGEGSPWTAVP